MLSLSEMRHNRTLVFRLKADIAAQACPGKRPLSDVAQVRIRAGSAEYATGSASS
jgi:hypothetical protein